MNVRYEWKAELVTNDEAADIVDMYHGETYAEVRRARFDELVARPHAYHVEVCLVRDRGNELDGLLDRQHAYVSDGKLPRYFEHGVRVPSRFHDELERN